MARLTYGVVAGALASLVAGFFVKTSTLPLVLSIGLSAVATLLILIGWGRRLRLESEGAERDAPEVEEIDFIELGAAEEEPRPRARRSRAPRTTRAPRPRAAEPRTTALDAVAADEEDLFADEEPPPPPARPRRAPRRPRTAAPEIEPSVDEPMELPDDTELTFELPEVTAAPRARRAAAPAPEPPAVRPAPKPKGSRKVVVVPGRGRYHTHDCRFAARGDAIELTMATARRRGYEACSVCAPDDL